MFLNAILLAGAAQGLILGILFLLKKKKMPVEILLGSWMLIIVFHLLVSFLMRTGQVNGKGLIILNSAVPLIQAPMIYFYFSLLFLGRVKTLRVAIHFIPAGLYLLYVFIGIPVPWLSKAFNGYLIGSVPVYTMWILRSWMIITKREASANRQASNWLKWPLAGLSGIWLTFLLLKFLPKSAELNLHPYFFISVAAFVYLVAIHAFRSALLLTPVINSTTLPKVSSLEEALKYSKSGLSEDKALEIRAQLELIMEEEKPFTEPELSLRALAGKLGVRENHLSQVINSIEGKGFYDYINGFRIREFLNLYKTHKKKNLTLLALALESGFSSKSSFNRIFKKEMGTSPSEYLKQDGEIL